MPRDLKLVPSRPPGDLCVARVPIFKSLSQEQQLDVAHVARPVHVDREEFLYLAQERVSQLMVVHTGRVKIFRTSVDGSEQLLRVLTPGDFVGELAFLTGQNPDHSAQAMEPSQLCVFAHNDLRQLVESHPRIGLEMLQEVSQRLSQTEARLASMSSSDVGTRLARYLLGLPSVPGAGGQATITLPLAKKDIASLLGTTPESLSRALRRLADAGVVDLSRGGQLLVRDGGRLSAQANGSLAGS